MFARSVAPRLPIDRRSPGCHQPLHREDQPNAQALHLDRQPRQIHRRRGRAQVLDYNRNCYKPSADERFALFRCMLFRVAAGVDPAAARHPGIRYVVAKTFPTVLNIDRFRNLFPGMGVFYIIRNGIEVVASLLRFPEKSALNFETACEVWAYGIDSHKSMFSTEYCALIRHDQLDERTGRNVVLSLRTSRPCPRSSACPIHIE